MRLFLLAVKLHVCSKSGDVWNCSEKRGFSKLNSSVCRTVNPLKQAFPSVRSKVGRFNCIYRSYSYLGLHKTGFFYSTWNACIGSLLWKRNQCKFAGTESVHVLQFRLACSFFAHDGLPRNIFWAGMQWVWDKEVAMVHRYLLEGSFRHTTFIDCWRMRMTVTTYRCGMSIFYLQRCLFMRDENVRHACRRVISLSWYNEGHITEGAPAPVSEWLTFALLPTPRDGQGFHSPSTTIQIGLFCYIVMLPVKYKFDKTIFSDRWGLVRITREQWERFQIEGDHYWRQRGSSQTCCLYFLRDGRSAFLPFRTSRTPPLLPTRCWPPTGCW